jgi:hypothetical protein
MLTGFVIANEVKRSLKPGRLLHFIRIEILCRMVFSILFIFLMNISFASCLTPGDPHCPCHKYQKIADEEYARLQNKKKNIALVISNEKLQNPDKNLGKQIAPANTFFFYHKKRKFNRKNEKVRAHRKTKNKISDKLSRCFHF